MQSTVSRQSWALSSEEPSVYPSGPAVYQRNGTMLCLPMVDGSHAEGAQGKSGGKKARGRGNNRGEGGEHFLYVWSIADVESKNVRHVSRRVAVPGGRVVKSVYPLMESRASIRRLSGDMSMNSRWVGAFAVVTEDGGVGVVGGEVQSMHLKSDRPNLPEALEHGESAGVEEVAMSYSWEKAAGHVLGVGVVAGGLRVVRRCSDGIRLEQLIFREYPSIESVGSVTLQTEMGAAEAVDAVGVAGDRVMLLAGRNVSVYHVGDNNVEGEVQPLLTRVLAADGGDAGTASNKKRKASRTALKTRTSTFVDGYERGYIIRSDSGMARVIVLDLLYGSVLWSGHVQGCEGEVAQVRRDALSQRTQARFLRSASEH